MTNFTIPQLTFIIIAPIICIIVLLIFGYLFNSLYYYPHHFNNVVYKKIYHLVNKKDYLLINNYSLDIDKTTSFKVNHIIFGKKFIYLINIGQYYREIKGKYNDPSFITYDKKGKKIYCPNLLRNLALLKKSLSLTFDLDESFFVGLYAINDDCIISCDNDNNRVMVVNLHKLKNTLKEIEKSEEHELDQEALLVAARNIASIGKRKE